MDLSSFQLVNAIHQIDILRNLSDEEQYHRKPRQPQLQPQQAYQTLHQNIDLLFEPEHQANSQFHMSRHQEASMLTPLVSPAMTPSSFNYNLHHHPKSSSSNDIDFSPLSSPAIMPQMNPNRYPQNPLCPEQQHRYTTDVHDNYETLTANQICEQYEQLEQAKLLITQRLSELQKNQKQHYTNTSSSSSPSVSLVYDKHGPIHSTTLLGNTGQMSTSNSPSQSPQMEPATPASLMNMKLSNAQPSKLQFSSSIRANMNSPATNNASQQFHPTTSNSTSVSFAPSSVSNNSNSKLFGSPIPPSNSHDYIMSSMATPSSSKTTPKSKASPSSLLAFNPHSQPSTQKTPTATSTIATTTIVAREKPSRPSSKKQRRETPSSEQTKAHASPRALKPLLISPTLNPGSKPLPSTVVASSIKNNRVHSVEDAERILATRSNYQNLMEGKGAALGIDFSTQIKSGLEVRRTAHKAAEQKRRDSLKEWFDRLRREVEDGYVKRQKTLMSRVIQAQELEKNASNNNKHTKHGQDDEMTEEEEPTGLKPLSKVLLLQYAYEYIASLKALLKDRDATIEKLSGGLAHDEKDDHDDKNANRLKRKTMEDENASYSSCSSSSPLLESTSNAMDDNLVVDKGL